MVRIVLEDELIQKLSDAGVGAELCDSEGRVVGYFQTTGPQPISPELMQWAREQISDDELERRCQVKEGISTEELLRRLKAL